MYTLFSSISSHFGDLSSAGDRPRRLTPELVPFGGVRWRVYEEELLPRRRGSSPWNMEGDADILSWMGQLRQRNMPNASCARIDLEVYPELGCMNAHREMSACSSGIGSPPDVEPE